MEGWGRAREQEGLYVHCINVQHIEVECIKWFQCCFHLPLLISIYSMHDGPLTRTQCKVSDTQVTVKACGPLD